MIYLYVALGGASGALARFATNQWVAGAIPQSLPLGTLLVNVAGSLAMGFLVGYSITGQADAWRPSEEIRALIGIGFLGAFTTFSAFSVDALRLLQQQEWLLFAAYIGLNVFLSIGACLLGLLGSQYLAS